jgi:hypothetical protein
MESYNKSVSPASEVRQSFRHFGHEDRDEIRRRAEADFPKLYLDHGGRCRGKALHCLFHEDGTPSASIHKGRFRCFTCNISLDAIEFVQRAQGTDFKGALSYLGDRYGVPLQSWRLLPADRAKYARQQRGLERDLPTARRWHRAALLLIEGVLAKLKAPLANPKEGPAEPDEIFRFEQYLLRLRRLEGAALVDEYRHWAEDNRLFTAGMVNAVEMREAAELLALEAYWAMAEARTS